MVKVLPFEGLLYNKDLIKKIGSVFAPPYDVISQEMQDELYLASDFNLVRLTLGKEFPTDNEYNNKYVRASSYFEGWQRHQVLVKDKKPVYYAYQQVFKVKSKKYSRLGFIGLLRLEDMGRGKVYPHEETHSKAKVDRLNLMKATSANLEPIFALFSDKKNKISKSLKKITKRKPVFEVKDKDKVIHRLWRVDRKPAIAKLEKEMKDKAVFIADGHHRYEAALRFKNEVKLNKTKFTEDDPFNHVMMYFTCLEDPGLAVFPIHRVVKGIKLFNLENFQANLAKYFEIEEYKASKRTAKKVKKKLLKDLKKKGQKAHAFALYLGQHRYFLLTLKSEDLVEEMAPEEKPAAWKKLDTTILHYTVFESILGITGEIPDKVVYKKDEEQAFALVDSGEAQMAFILNPGKIDDIVEIASKLEKMPQKSTYFYPKLLSGLVINKLEETDTNLF